MHFSTILTCGLFSLVSIAAQIEQPQVLDKRVKRSLELQVRQKPGELAFCFGRQSICANSNRLNDECDDRTGDERYTCLCTNGFVSTRQACGWCNDAWGIDQISGIDDIYTSRCSSVSATIAPIPATVLERQSSYNATWTGTLLGHATLTGAVTTTRDRSTSVTTTSRSSRETIDDDFNTELATEVASSAVLPTRSSTSSTSRTFLITDTTTIVEMGGGAQNFPRPTAPVGNGGSGGQAEGPSNPQSGSASGASSSIHRGITAMAVTVILLVAAMVAL